VGLPPLGRDFEPRLSTLPRRLRATRAQRTGPHPADGELTVADGSYRRSENDERRSEERRWCVPLSTRSWNQIWSWLENIEKSRPLLESVIR
ncbi:MAG: hypothetical protein L7U55_07330, partial [Candidatus Nanopelagicales bacterium]|nr:hypothetical protein [Candidatus Nanopelagicales bacterium]